MYNGIRKIEEIITYIESNLTSELDYEKMAKIMNLSVYEFRRIFSFLIGCPISEYVRKRRLSLAAAEIIASDKVDISKISEKYGYSTQSSFTRAFREYHGIAPSDCLNGKSALNLFTRPIFSVSISGIEDIPYKIIKTETFYIKGFSGISEITDTCCCENVWNMFYESDSDKKLNTDMLFVSYRNMGENVKCCIGEKAEDGEIIPESRWVCFTMTTVDDKAVNEIYSKIIYDWFPSSNLERNENIPTVEVYPFDMSEDGFSWEIRIPIK